MSDEKLKECAEMKSYVVVVNGISGFTDAQSLGEALRHAGDLRLNETDIITVKLEQ